MASPGGDGQCLVSSAYFELRPCIGCDAVVFMAGDFSFLINRFFKLRYFEIELTPTCPAVAFMKLYDHGFKEVVMPSPVTVNVLDGGRTVMRLDYPESTQWASYYDLRPIASVYARHMEGTHFCYVNARLCIEYTHLRDDKKEESNDSSRRQAYKRVVLAAAPTNRVQDTKQTIPSAARTEAAAGGGPTCVTQTDPWSTQMVLNANKDMSQCYMCLNPTKKRRDSVIR